MKLYKPFSREQVQGHSRIKEIVSDSYELLNEDYKKGLERTLCLTNGFSYVEQSVNRAIDETEIPQNLLLYFSRDKDEFELYKKCDSQHDWSLRPKCQAFVQACNNYYKIELTSLIYLYIIDCVYNGVKP